MNKLLVINAGSSTIKWKMFFLKNLKVIAEGVADRIGIDGQLTLKHEDKKHNIKQTINNHIEAINLIIEILREHHIIVSPSEIKIIGHRVVHGGDYFKESAIINEDNLKKIENLSTLAPLHNPNAVKVIKACLKLCPEALQSATFDTSFHTTIPWINNTYPINKKIAKELKIKKYGFHGTSHR